MTVVCEKLVVNCKGVMKNLTTGAARELSDIAEAGGEPW